MDHYIFIKYGKNIRLTQELSCVSTILCILIGLVFVHGVQESKFYTGVLCDLNTRIAEKCSKPVPDVHTQNVCVFRCSKNQECIGASVLLDKRVCYNHFPCSTDLSKCVKEEDGHKYLSKNCAHSGVWKPETLTCACTNGWIGQHCLDLPTVCLDLGNGGYPKGNHRTYLKSLTSSHIPVTCVIVPSMGYSHIRGFANAGNGNFGNRTWEEYKNGFYVDIDNMWIGLIHWNALSKVGYSEYIVFMEAGNTYQTYYNFQVKGELEEFSFTFNRSSRYPRYGPFLIEFPDCFGLVQNAPFSAKDNDRDGVPSENCADRVGGGWWFSGTCNLACNLLGVAPNDWHHLPRDKWMRLEGTSYSKLQHAAEDGQLKMMSYL